MKQIDERWDNLTPRQKLVIAGVTALFAGIGAVLGVIAYYQNWLG